MPCKHYVLLTTIAFLPVVMACATTPESLFSTAVEDLESGGKRLTIKHGTDLTTLNAGRPERIQEVLDQIPETHHVEVEVVMVSRALTGYEHDVYYASRISALDPAGRRDGPEVQYRNWHQSAIRRAHYRQGKLHGVERHFSVDGRVLETEIPWENGEIHGVRKNYHSNGQVQTETPHTRGTVEGESRTFDRDGRLIRVVHFVNGRRHGTSTDFWSENPDQVQRVIPYVEGQVHGVARAYYLDGTLHWERSFVDNQLHGVERHYDGAGEERRVVYWLQNEMVSQEDWEAAGAP